MLPAPVAGRIITNTAPPIDGSVRKCASIAKTVCHPAERKRFPDKFSSACPKVSEDFTIRDTGIATNFINRCFLSKKLIGMIIAVLSSIRRSGWIR
jgi:hypothetical protein